MDQGPSASPRLDEEALSIGLGVLRPYYAGLGGVLEALSPSDDASGYDAWSSSDVQARINRVLWGRIEADVSALPTDRRLWEEALPPATLVRVRDQDRIAGTVDWARTAVQHGWPPNQFVVRTRDRVRNTLPMSVLCWVAARVRTISGDAERLASGILGQDVKPLGLLRDLVPEGGESAPSWGEVEAVRREGGLWESVARLALRLLDAQSRPDELLVALIEPEDEEGVSGRIFQLATMGLIVSWFEANGRVTPLRPISTGGKAVFAVSLGERCWNVIFETAFPWAESSGSSLYAQAREGMPGGSTRLRVDLGLRPPKGGRGLVVECKYSRNLNYVASGFPQVLGYLAEARHAGLLMDGLVVGPAQSVRSLHWVHSEHHRAAICDTRLLRDALRDFTQVRP